MFSARPRVVHVAEERNRAQQKLIGRERSPNAGKPDLEVLTGPESAPGDVIQLAGPNKAGSTIEIAIDGRQVERSGKPPAIHAVLDHFAWRHHCRGLFQMPIAA
jgi:hypothetical protein